MQNITTGVQTGSSVYFHTPSGLEKLMFLYPLCVGHFYCDSTYETLREDFDNYLIMYIKKGSGTLIYNNKQSPLKRGDLVFIDCNKLHSYKTDAGWETLWMHFNGICAKNYYDIITDRLGNTISIDEGIVYQVLYKIFKNFHKNENMNEAIISSYIQRILAHLYEITSTSKQEKSVIYDVLHYIDVNYKENISIDSLCSLVHLSPYYFSRLFKKELGYSPYEYLIIVRLNAAKKLLKHSYMTIKEIAFETGFNSEANFIRTFKSYTDMTPGKFRKFEL